HSLSQQRTHAAAIHFFPFWLCTEEAESLIRYPALTMQDRHAILALIKPMVLSPIGSVLSPDPRRTFITWCFTVVYPATRLLLVSAVESLPLYSRGQLQIRCQRSKPEL